MVVIGLAIGSFLNVVIYRLPRGESLWNPPSHCPQCGNRIAWYDNIPVVSFILLRGKCRHCHARIPWRYPLVEVLCGLLFLLTSMHHLPSSTGLPSLIGLLKAVVFVSFLLPIFFIDLEHQIIPDSLSYPLLLSGIFFSSLQGLLIPSLIGAAVGAGIFFAILYLSLLFLRQEGMGMGDVKLAAGIGAYFGWQIALLAFFSSFLIGAVGASMLLLLSRKGMKDRIAFGPFLVIGGFVMLFFGAHIYNFYFSLVW